MNHKTKCLEALKELKAPGPGEWECVHVFDYGEASFTCELCSYEKVRYIHVMTHEKWDGEIYTGCVCAGFLQGDEEQARDEEKRAKRKLSFMSKKWKQLSASEWGRKYKKHQMRMVFRSSRYFLQIDEKKCGSFFSFLKAMEAAFDQIDSEGCC